MDLIQKLMNNRTKRVSSFIGEIDSEIQKYKNNIHSLNKTISDMENYRNKLEQDIKIKEAVAEKLYNQDMIYKDIALRFLPPEKPLRKIQRHCSSCFNHTTFILEEGEEEIATK